MTLSERRRPLRMPHVGKRPFSTVFRKHWQLYLLMAIPIAWMLVFLYAPMYGVVIAFKNFSVLKGIHGSPWVGFREFDRLLGSFQFWNIVRNTVVIAFVRVAFAFPAAIVLALALNEMRWMKLRRSIQTIAFAPHFISTVVMAGMILTFLDPRFGFIGFFFDLFGIESVSLIADPSNFAIIYALSEVWQHMGFAAVIYIAALSAVDVELYDAARIDGASKLQKILNIDIPGIRATIVILLILEVGNVMTLGFEKVYLLQNPLNLASSEIIATYVYKIGLEARNYSLGAAVDLFNGVLNLVLIVSANLLSRRLSEISLW